MRGEERLTKGGLRVSSIVVTAVLVVSVLIVVSGSGGVITAIGVVTVGVCTVVLVIIATFHTVAALLAAAEFVVLNEQRKSSVIRTCGEEARADSLGELRGHVTRERRGRKRAGPQQGKRMRVRCTS